MKIRFQILLLTLSTLTPSLSFADMAQSLPDNYFVQCTIQLNSETSEKNALKNLEDLKKSNEIGGFDLMELPSHQIRAGSYGLTKVELDKKEKPFTQRLKQIATQNQGSIQCESQQQPNVVFKPVIYLYPTQSQEVLVQLDYQGKLIADYPDYNPEIKGWKVQAFPDGHLINSEDGQEYSYLFWEGQPREKPNYDLSEGFVVAGKDTKIFLQKTLKNMGLTPKEYNEFIVYWLPKMQDNAYNLIHFAGESYTQSAPLKITPQPDSMLRVFMVFKKLERPIEIKTQKISNFERKGFSVVEWGGSEIN